MNISNKNHGEIVQILNEAYLNLSVDEDALMNPLDIPLIYQSDPGLWLGYVMSQPEYFSFICKEILNINLLPFQAVIQKEFWNHRFPMAIASRGASKSFSLALYCILRMLVLPKRKIVCCSAAFRQSKTIFNYMKSIWNNAPILRDIAKGYSEIYGPRESPDMFTFSIGSSTSVFIPVGPGGDKIRGQRSNDLICVSKDTLINTDIGLIKIGDFLDGKDKKVLNSNNTYERPSHMIITEPTDVYQIEVRNGFRIKCSATHRLMTHDGWKFAKDLTVNDRLEISTHSHFPSKQISYKDITIDEKMGYLLGILISEGSVESRNYIGVTNTDYKLIKHIKESFDFNWSEYHKPAYIDDRGFNCKESWTIKFACTEFREKLRDLGLDYCIHRDKKIPWCILQSPKSVVIEFMRGLFKGDGTGFQITPSGKTKLPSCGLAYYSSSEELVRSLQTFLLNFGIYATVCDRSSKLSIHRQWVLQLRGENAVKMCDILGYDLKHETKFIAAKPYVRANGERFTVSVNRADRSLHIGTFDTAQEAEEHGWNYLHNAKKLFKVKSVTKLSDKEVLYDFHMPESHSFIGNGFVNHNCDEFNCLRSNTLCQTEKGLLRIKDYLDDFSPRLLNAKNEFDTPERIIRTPEPVDVYEVKTQYGFSFACSEKHQVQTEHGWQIAKDIKIGDKLPISSHTYFPSEYIIYDGEKLTEDIAFAYGLYANIDEEQNTLDYFYKGILQSPQSVVSQFIDALFIKDQTTWKHHNKQFVKDIQILMLSFKKMYARHSNILIIKEYEDSLPVLYIDLLPEKEILYDFHLPKDNSFIGNGFIQHNSIPKEIFETVMAAFNAVSADPISSAKIAASIKLAEKYNLNIEDYIDINSQKAVPNQLIIAGTAGYTFEHFYEYWKDWKQIICAKNDRKKLEEYLYRKQLDSELDQDDILKNLNSDDYSIIRLPYNLIPEGFMDAAQVTRSKATMHSGTYNSEFGACIINDDALILTQDGYKEYKNINVGDLVLTHMGRWKKVTAKKHRYYDGKAYNISIHGHNRIISVTEDHPFFVGNETYKSVYNEEYLYFPKLSDLSNLQEIDDDSYFKLNIRNVEEFKHKGIVYNLEVEDDHTYILEGVISHNCFADDSNGFFKATLIKSATVSPSKPISNEDDPSICFGATTHGSKQRKYIYGIDPASESDNLAIVILEVHNNHRRVVYSWTTNKEQHRYEVKNNITDEHDYFAYCVRKIRDLMRTFPCIRIMLDAGGGGVSIREALGNPKLLQDGEQAVYEVIEDGKDKDSDMFSGLHILEMCQFRRSDWLAEANNGLKFDLERKILLFPYFDPVALAIAEGEDLTNIKIYDSLEYIMLEIEELKKELTTIVVSINPNGSQKWTTPEVKTTTGKGKMRKDRYSALLIANMGARQMNIQSFHPYNREENKLTSSQMYVGNENHTKGLNIYSTIYGEYFN